MCPMMPMVVVLLVGLWASDWQACVLVVPWVKPGLQQVAEEVHVPRPLRKKQIWVLELEL